MDEEFETGTRSNEMPSMVPISIILLTPPGFFLLAVTRGIVFFEDVAIASTIPGGLLIGIVLFHRKYESLLVRACLSLIFILLGFCSLFAARQLFYSTFSQFH